MTPKSRYASDISSGLISPDQAQEEALEHLERLHAQLCAGYSVGPGLLSTVRRWIARVGTPPQPVKGVYLWGGVGRGKTYLMDLFYDCLPFQDKLRTHFHRFMQRVHSELAAAQGQKNPLRRIAADIAARSRVICFDEFFVQDIGDAMILAGLLDALVEQGVTLVMTSNVHPQQLYENGLQRERFLPAIALLLARTETVQISSGTDYRLRSLSQATLYHCPVDPDTERQLLASFNELVPDKAAARQTDQLTILQRTIPVRRCAEDVAWFDFDVLCNSPRSAFDYVELARLFHAVILSGVPVMDDSCDDQARRFIALIDEFYDRRVKLIIAAAAPIQDLYQGASLAFEFQRTRSRLIEMQSHEYLASSHRA